MRISISAVSFQVGSDSDLVVKASCQLGMGDPIDTFFNGIAA
jgi:hypothetical protein